MIARLSLRLRVFLFFALLAVGGLLITAGGLVAGYRRAANPELLNSYMFSGVIIGFLVLALVVAVWLLFDEHVAKPIEHLATDLRARAHAGVTSELDTDTARYLGDLAPAAQAVAGQLGDATLRTAAAIASETARVEADAARLSAVLSEIPVATLIIGAQHKVVLYDAQAAAAFEAVGPLCLNGSLFDYVEEASVKSAYRALARSGEATQTVLRLQDGATSLPARLLPMSGAPGYIILIDSDVDALPFEGARPLVFDFELLERDVDADLRDTALSALSCTVFDTETTGLLPHKDHIVQIGAVHVLNGREISGEALDLLIDPGRAIPAASTAVHGISDAMVAGKPDIIEAGQRLHRFASGSVIVAHNAPFDMAFLHRDAGEMGVEWTHPILDTVLISAVLYGTTAAHTLDALCGRLDVRIPEVDRHTALGDAKATAQVFCRMIPLLEAQGIRTLGDLLTETRRHGRLLEDMN